jgi:gas vesicle protein
MSIIDLLEKGKKARQKKVRETALKNVAIGAAIGASVGAVAGVMLAPKSGKENREDLAKAVKEIPEKAKEIVEITKEKMEEVKEKLKEKQTKSTEALGG